MSRPLVVDVGVPQGAILSPLLFNIFASDLASAIKSSSLFQYADDCYLFKAVLSKSDTQQLQEDIDALTKWGADNNLLLNIHKCSFIIFTRKPRAHNVDIIYNIDGVSIQRVFSIKLLGVIFDSDLKWDSHVNYVCSRARRLNGFILRNVGTTNAAIPLYQSIVLPVIEYGAQIRLC